MRRLTFSVAAMSVLMLAVVASSAGAGFTDEETRLAIEFSRRLADSKSPIFDQELARTYRNIYLRRAYALDPEPAEVLAKEVEKREYRLKGQDRQQYFAWGLDALVRGASLADIRATISAILSETMHENDKTYYLDVLLRNASTTTSPVPMIELMAKARGNGVVGRNLRELVSWAMGHVIRGEDTVYLKQFYDAVTQVTPFANAQRAFMNKCYTLIEQRVPPRALADAATRLAKRFNTIGALESAIDDVVRRYRSGQPFAEALNTVDPP
jgi:hypothetical protein